MTREQQSLLVERADQLEAAQQLLEEAYEMITTALSGWPGEYRAAAYLYPSLQQAAHAQTDFGQPMQSNLDELIAELRGESDDNEI